MRPVAAKFCLLLIAVLYAPSCVDDAPELYIRGNKILPDNCQLDVSMATEPTSRTFGVFDVYLATRLSGAVDGYRMFPAIENTLAPAGTVGFGGPPGIEGADWPANSVTYDRAEISYEFPEEFDLDLPDEADPIRFADTVDAQGNSVISLDVISSELAEAIAESDLLQEYGSSIYVDVLLRVFGRTAAQRSVGSNEFRYRVRVCNGCLINTLPEAVDPTADVQPNCRNLEEFEGDDAPCLIGQDELVDCRFVCPTLVAGELDNLGICEPNF